MSPPPEAPPLDLAPFAAQLEGFLARCHEPGAHLDAKDLRGRFAARPGAPPDLYGCADAVYVLWILDELDARTRADGRRAWVERLQAFQDPGTGWFDRGSLHGHDRPHATAFATAALALLGAAPRHPLRAAAAHFRSRASTEAWLAGFRWSQIWTGSHAAGAAAALIDAPAGVALPADWSDGLLEALDARVDPRTGLWKNGPLDRLWRRPTAIDLGGAAHFWWLYERLGRAIPHPERAVESILGLQRRSGLWGNRLFGGAYPHGLDFDALRGLRAAWPELPPGRREALRAPLARALDRYVRAVDRHLNAPGSVARRFPSLHKLVGTLHALAELELLSRAATGGSRLAMPRPWRSALDVVSWQ